MVEYLLHNVCYKKLDPRSPQLISKTGYMTNQIPV